MPNWNHIVREHFAVLRLPPEREIEIVEEQALHLEAAYEDALADGLSEAAAEARAVQSYDWRLLECELSRAEQPLAARAMQPSLELIERNGGMRMVSLTQDLRYGARMLIRNPGFTLIAALTLALGIGANTAIFSVVNGVLLKPLPYPEPERLMRIFQSIMIMSSPKAPMSPADFRDFREQNTTFETIAGYFRQDLELAQGERAERLLGMRASSGYFRTLGFHPMLG